MKVELERQRREVLDEQVKRIEDSGGTVLGTHLRLGRVAEEIVGLAEEIGVGLIVLGSRSLGPLGRLVMGSECLGGGGPPRPNPRGQLRDALDSTLP